LANAINFKENYPELKDFRADVMRVVNPSGTDGIAKMKDKAAFKVFANNLFEKHPEMKDIIMNHYVEWVLFKDKDKDLKEYVALFGLPQKI